MDKRLSPVSIGNECVGRAVGPFENVKLVTCYISIREIPGFNLGRATDYPDQSFLWFCSTPSGKCRDYSLHSDGPRLLFFAKCLLMI
jgi:hypothetical protein